MKLNIIVSVKHIDKCKHFRDHEKTVLKIIWQRLI